MNESNKKTAMQAGLMIVLFLLLAGLVVRMVTSMKPPRKHKTTTTASVPAEKGDTPSATNMPRVPKSGEPISKAGMELSQADLHLNPNQFKVYSLNPPKNPFVQTEDMYQDELKKIPGYPQLKSTDYLNETDAYLPNLPLISEHDWDSIQVSRQVHVDPYQIMGTSEDGTVTTNIRLTPKSPPSSQIVWSPATGVPVKELMQRGVAKRYADELSGEDKIVQASKDEGGFVADALGVPGVGGARSSGEALDGDGGEGDSLFAVGVSHHGKEATALVRHNGKTRIVREGSVLPTHYQVLTIKENGVVVIDLRDGSSKWLPLGAAPAEDPKKVARKAKSA